MAKHSDGYWLLERSGGVYTFGDTTFHGALADLNITTTAIALAPTPTGNGYTICDTAGSIYTFGDATFHGALGSHQNASAMLRHEDGYYILDEEGRVFAFGLVPSLGSPEFDENVYFVDIAR